MSIYDKASLVQIPSGYKSGTLYNVLPNDADGDFDFTRASTATRVDENGLIETIATGTPRLNYPLLDGVVQDNPTLLLEPQRTNYVFPSNDFSSWSVSGGSVSITPNYGISPDGTQNSSRTDFSNGAVIYQIPNRPQGAYVFSVFAKNIEGGGSVIELRVDVPASFTTRFDLSNGTIVSSDNDDAKIEYYGNGWYRCIIIQNNDGIVNTVIGEGTTELDCELFGGMLEEGSYATSYIPTSGSSVTRSADVANGAGTADDFNDSEGVLYANIAALADDGTPRQIALNNGTSNRIMLNLVTTSNTIQLYLVATSEQANITQKVSSTVNFNKCAAKYKNNDVALWLNGFEVGIDGVANMPTGLNQLDFDNGGGTFDFYGNTKEVIVFNEALSDTELEALTSYDSFKEMATEQLYTIE